MQVPEPHIEVNFIKITFLSEVDMKLYVLYVHTVMTKYYHSVFAHFRAGVPPLG